MPFHTHSRFWPLGRLILGILALVLLVAGLQSARAQDSAMPQPAPDPADALSFMLGEWDGTGWTLTPTGDRSEFEVHESIRSRSGGHGVTFEGRGMAPTGPDGEMQIVHDAFALIWAERDGSYAMRSVVMQGFSLQVIPEIGENTFAWGFDAGPYGETRYVSTIEDGVWHELGERRVGDGEWTIFLEMTLARVTN